MYTIVYAELHSLIYKQAKIGAPSFTIGTITKNTKGECIKYLKDRENNLDSVESIIYIEAYKGEPIPREYKSNYIFPSGKYKGVSLDDVASFDYSFILFLIKIFGNSLEPNFRSGLEALGLFREK